MHQSYLEIHCSLLHNNPVNLIKYYQTCKASNQIMYSPLERDQEQRKSLPQQQNDTLKDVYLNRDQHIAFK